jgi:diguanylate cyclase (GGDEF)-like protein
MTLTDYVTSAIDVIALLFLAGLVHGNSILNRLRKKPFIYGILLTILVIVAEVGTLVFGQDGFDLRFLHVLFNVVGFSLTPLIPLILIAIFHLETIKKRALFLLPTGINGIMSLLSPWFGWIFSIDGNNFYARGPLFGVFVAVYLFNIFLLLVSTHRSGKRHLYSIRAHILGLTLFAVIGTCVQLLIPSIYSSWHCVTLSLFLYYILLTDFDGSFDPLTGLYNRAAFEKATSQLKSGTPFSIVVMDINLFKEINDTCGHDYGDLVLKSIAITIRNAFNDGTPCFRIGGDEFCVITKEVHQEDLEQRLKQMTVQLSLLRHDDRHLPTLSYGFSTYHGVGAVDFTSIVKEADNQMYYYKNLQKNLLKP